MPRPLIGLLLAALTLTVPACNPDPAETGAASTPATQPTPKAPPPPPPDEPPVPDGFAAADPAPEQLGKDAEPLPEPPKAGPKSELKPLNAEKTLLLELAPDPADPAKKKAVRVLIAAEVCMRQGPLEVLMCKKNTKEHEAIVRADLDARFVHAALIAAGGKPGSPVQFINPKTDEPEYKPATGTRTLVTVHYRKGGKLHTHPAQEWVIDRKTMKPMAHQWVFAGSRFLKNPDRPNDPDYYAANNGEVIAISNFVDSMLDLPVEVSRDNAELAFSARTERIPPLLSKVWVILEPVPGA